MKRIEFSSANDVSIIKPLGEMTFFFLEELNTYLNEQKRLNHFKFVFDMTLVTWIDSIGLGLIATSIKSALLNNVKVAVVKPRQNIVELFKMSSLYDLIEVFDNVEKAVEYFK